MLNVDPVINGYSQSVIDGLIRTLDAEADKCLQKAIKMPAGEDHDEVVAMRNLAKTHGTLIKMLMKWSVCTDRFDIITRHVVAFKDFLGGVRYILEIASPATTE
jgi:hypothetical protein